MAISLLYLYLENLIFDYFKTKIVMKHANQSNKAWKSNYSQNFGGEYSRSMITIQLKLIANNRIVKVLKNRKFCLIYSVFCIVSKQAVKVPKSR